MMSKVDKSHVRTIMRNEIQKILLCLSFFLAFMVAGGEVASKRLAVIDIGQVKQVLPGFSDLVFIELGKKTGVELLEQSDIHRLIQEQALDASQVDLKGRKAVKAGKLWNVDAFLMLEIPAEPVSTGKKSDKTLKQVRARLDAFARKKGDNISS